VELIGTIVLAALAIVGAATSQQLTDEFKAWSPWIIRKIIQRAVRQLPEDQRERFAEEWRAHTDEVPGDVGKLVVALGFLSAAREISSGSARDRLSEIGKRLFDIAFSGFFLAALFPLCVVAAVAIKLESRGPILLRHTLYGYNNKTIRILAFRSEVMTKKANGPPVTRVGSVLRRLNLDMLPQLLNVLSGEMSLVGPRPHSNLEGQLPPNVKPGITGWAQINGFREEYADSLQQMRIRLDRDQFYANNRSFLLDLKIFLKTLLLGFFKK
jgi:lipopolysaccharide/colanic/teichoic acid biosynthesis glycosyltransferase